MLNTLPHSVIEKWFSGWCLQSLRKRKINTQRVFSKVTAEQYFSQWILILLWVWRYPYGTSSKNVGLFNLTMAITLQKPKNSRLETLGRLDSNSERYWKLKFCLEKPGDRALAAWFWNYVLFILKNTILCKEPSATSFFFSLLKFSMKVGWKKSNLRINNK